MDVVALGELLIDFTENGVSGQGNPLFEANPGGAPCNVLAMLSRLGHRTAFIGKVGNDFFGKQLEDAITERSSVFANGNDRSRIPVTQEQREPLYSQIMQPIISAGDTVGSVLLLGKNERDVMGESEKMLIRTASGFLGRQMEQ